MNNELINSSIITKIYPKIPNKLKHEFCIFVINANDIFHVKSPHKTLKNITKYFSFLFDKKNSIQFRNYGCDCNYCLNYDWHNCENKYINGEWKGHIFNAIPFPTPTDAKTNDKDEDSSTDTDADDYVNNYDVHSNTNNNSVSLPPSHISTQHSYSNHSMNHRYGSK